MSLPVSLDLVSLSPFLFLPACLCLPVYVAVCLPVCLSRLILSPFLFFPSLSVSACLFSVSYFVSLYFFCVCLCLPLNLFACLCLVSVSLSLSAVSVPDLRIGDYCPICCSSAVALHRRLLLLSTIYIYTNNPAVITEVSVPDLSMNDHYSISCSRSTRLKKCVHKYIIYHVHIYYFGLLNSLIKLPFALTCTGPRSLKS